MIEWGVLAKTKSLEAAAAFSPKWPSRPFKSKPQ
jgi:hypothetical protein